MTRGFRTGSRARAFCAGLLAVALLGACGRDDPLPAYSEQLAVCDLAQDNGLLDEAVEACAAALDARVASGDPGSYRGSLALRLAALERQRGRFGEGQRWLELAERSGEVDPAALGIEQAMLLAGQNRWDEGVTLLKNLLPTCMALEGDLRARAENAYAGYARKLKFQGDPKTARWLEAAASRLAVDPGPAKA